ncbi:hypothetical protein HGM15179_013554 [Zosterops borbonicus]|uniref:Uncharacterized protein n=1 Tax=Zosterops borbonicus TaxID=364589 RepID=A0A8K1G7T6_9PASS|nr:hypothetical protein HGM15179_013554 [Zosterops borbonicus]
MLWLLRAPAAAREQLTSLLPSTGLGQGTACSGWGIGLLGVRQRWESPVDHLVDPHMEEAKFGTSQLERPHQMKDRGPVQDMFGLLDIP